MAKIATSLKIIDILLDENLHKAKDISKKLDISESAVRWYINELIIAGIYIESLSGPMGGYIMRKEYSANNIYKLLKHD